MTKSILHAHSGDHLQPITRIAFPETWRLMQAPMAIDFAYTCVVLVCGVCLNLPLPCICFSGKPTMQANRKFIKSCHIQAAQTENIPIQDTSSCSGNCTRSSLAIPLQRGELHHILFMLCYANVSPLQGVEP